VTGGIQHSKFFITDRRVAWLGSQNFDWRSLEHIFEVGVRINDERLVGELFSIFETDWALRTTNDRRAVEKVDAEPREWVPFQYSGESHFGKIVASPEVLLPKKDYYDLPHILDSVNQANQRISLQLRKYGISSRNEPQDAWTLVHYALRDAAARGVQVRLMFDEQVAKNPRQHAAVADLAQKANVEVRLVRIPESSEGPLPFARMLHAKTLTVDAKISWVGTGNLGPDDFLRSRNVGILVKGAEFSRDIEAIFERCWLSTYCVTI
jgi:phosphatidylserine/phosphatidylglycerophosphate/cardiolipin synthase-like enzyme